MSTRRLYSDVLTPLNSETIRSMATHIKPKWINVKLCSWQQNTVLYHINALFFVQPEKRQGSQQTLVANTPAICFELMNKYNIASILPQFILSSKY